MPVPEIPLRETKHEVMRPREILAKLTRLETELAAIKRHVLLQED